MDTSEQDVSGYDNLPKPDTLIECRMADGRSVSGEQTSNVRASLSPKDRVRKHRAKLQNQERRRFEVCINASLIEQVAQIARYNHEPLWSAVEKALEAHVKEYRELAAESRRLKGECTRLRGQPDSREWRRQVAEHNRKLVVFTERLVSFQKSHRPSVQAVRGTPAAREN